MLAGEPRQTSNGEIRRKNNNASKKALLNTPRNGSWIVPNTSFRFLQELRCFFGHLIHSQWRMRPAQEVSTSLIVTTPRDTDQPSHHHLWELWFFMHTYMYNCSICIYIIYNYMCFTISSLLLVHHLTLAFRPKTKEVCVCARTKICTVYMYIMRSGTSCY